jgi:hypothetical protein
VTTISTTKLFANIALLQPKKTLSPARRAGSAAGSVELRRKKTLAAVLFEPSSARRAPFTTIRT